MLMLFVLIGSVALPASTAGQARSSAFSLTADQLRTDDDLLQSVNEVRWVDSCPRSLASYVCQQARTSGSQLCS